jgi:hypothetical protein
MAANTKYSINSFFFQPQPPAVARQEIMREYPRAAGGSSTHPHAQHNAISR